MNEIKTQTIHSLKNTIELGKHIYNYNNTRICKSLTHLFGDTNIIIVGAPLYHFAIYLVFYTYMFFYEYKDKPHVTYIYICEYVCVNSAVRIIDV